MRQVLVVKSGGAAALPEWQAAFAACAPDLELRWWDDPTLDPAAVDFALVWDPEPGRLAQLPNLKVIFGSGAGVDAIIADPDLPRHLPLVRMGVEGAAQRMGEYACWAALSLLRGTRRLAIAQAEARWDYFEPDFTAREKVVGIMGLGVMGTRAAEMLGGIGFPVIGWSRTPKVLPGVESFAGDAARDAFLAKADILVVLLPATEATRGLIAAPLLARVKPGTGLIHAGRGSQAVVDDVLAALDSGQLGGAVIDVFEQEPLPADSPAWQHPRLTVTPHVASLPSRRERAAHVATCIAAFRRGDALPNLYDHGRGY
ncbi:glyoxylate/hydroxypyruvate reductase A [Roseomonas hellenica]|uniref:Glyoxylate/hydroxypyruvate reductase A n=1 Tax=Plastoroseomonas hellenica TaxID=2687306 RepID=A0ABS5F5U4_9PROT|nr:glyoxylate/hydroxypyruvate reductase A [Plastoroseomonas hellenica]MBR0667918.1 glyoxylate/hydroxypyruvate reductase A [Plastoroseomonas hellenica]